MIKLFPNCQRESKTKSLKAKRKDNGCYREKGQGLHDSDLDDSFDSDSDRETLVIPLVTVVRGVMSVVSHKGNVSWN